MSTRRLREGDVVAFDFTIEHPVAGRRGEHRIGVGIVASNEVDYSTWPPGYTLRVESSEHYKPGTFISVAPHSLRKLRGS